MTPPTAAKVPWAAWLLVAATAIHLIVRVITGGILSAYPNLAPGAIVGTLFAPTAFLLAAAIVIGADRWRPGRRWLLLGAATFTIGGVVDIGQQAWFAWWRTSSAGFTSEAAQAVLAVGGVAGGVVGIASSGFVAAGLWSARHPLPPAGGSRLVAMVALGALGAIAGLATIAIAASSGADPAISIDTAAYVVLAMGQPAATAFVGIAALRCLPTRDRRPELLVAIGAGLLVGAAAWIQWLLLLAQQEALSGPWVWAIEAAGVLGLLGMLGLTAGFAAGWLYGAPQWDSGEGDPRPK